MTVELGFPRPWLKKIALENVNDAAGPQWVRKLRQKGLLALWSRKRNFNVKEGVEEISV